MPSFGLSPFNVQSTSPAGLFGFSDPIVLGLSPSNSGGGNVDEGPHYACVNSNELSPEKMDVHLPESTAAPVFSFGSPASNQSLFASGLFGSNAHSVSPSGLFGSHVPSTCAPDPPVSSIHSTSGSGLFGSNAQSTSPSGLFGSSIPSTSAPDPQGPSVQSTSATGLFGLNALSVSTSGLFGSSVPSTSAPGFSVQSTSASSLFGSRAQSTSASGPFGLSLQSTSALGPSESNTRTSPGFGQPLSSVPPPSDPSASGQVSEQEIPPPPVVPPPPQVQAQPHSHPRPAIRMRDIRHIASRLKPVNQVQEEKTDALNDIDPCKQVPGQSSSETQQEATVVDEQQATQSNAPEEDQDDIIQQQEVLHSRHEDRFRPPPGSSLQAMDNYEGDPSDDDDFAHYARFPLPLEAGFGASQSAIPLPRLLNPDFAFSVTNCI